MKNRRWERGLRAAAVGVVSATTLALGVTAAGAATTSGPGGDFAGDARHDLVVKRASGEIRVFETRAGDVYQGRNVIGRFGADQQVLVVGDATGDGLDDIVALNGSTLLLYPQRTTGYLGKAVEVGRGFPTTARLTAAGDITGEGHPAILARLADGSLWGYGFQAGGRLVGMGKLATGWGQFSQVVGVGDLTGDGRSDVVALRGTALFLYRGMPPGLRLVGGVGGGFTGTLAGPGDVVADGHPDLVSSTTDGRVTFYRGVTGGFRSTGLVVALAGRVL